MPTENTDCRVILYVVREIQDDLNLKTAKPLNLFFLFSFNFHSCTVDFDTIKLFYVPTDAQ
jgi:hypothetical protein